MTKMMKMKTIGHLRETPTKHTDLQQLYNKD